MVRISRRRLVGDGAVWVDANVAKGWRLHNHQACRIQPVAVGVIGQDIEYGWLSSRDLIRVVAGGGRIGVARCRSGRLGGGCLLSCG